MRSPYVHYKNGHLFIEQVPIQQLADQIGTPFYAYTRAGIEAALASYTEAFSTVPHIVCYSLKANSNLALATLLARQGGGADIVSGGELRRALIAGFKPEKIIFSGVGKTKDELTLAIKKGIRLINVESEEELKGAERRRDHAEKTGAVFAARESRRARGRTSAHLDGHAEKQIRRVSQKYFPAVSVGEEAAVSAPDRHPVAHPVRRSPM